jgi:hypothetical protein
MTFECGWITCDPGNDGLVATRLHSATGKGLLQ